MKVEKRVLRSSSVSSSVPLENENRATADTKPLIDCVGSSAVPAAMLPPVPGVCASTRMSACDCPAAISASETVWKVMPEFGGRKPVPAGIRMSAVEGDT